MLVIAQFSLSYEMFSSSLRHWLHPSAVLQFIHFEEFVHIRKRAENSKHGGKLVRHNCVPCIFTGWHKPTLLNKFNWWMCSAQLQGHRKTEWATLSETCMPCKSQWTMPVLLLQLSQQNKRCHCTFLYRGRVETSLHSNFVSSRLSFQLYVVTALWLSSAEV